MELRHMPFIEIWAILASHPGKGEALRGYNGTLIQTTRPRIRGVGFYAKLLLCLIAENIVGDHETTVQRISTYTCTPNTPVDQLLATRTTISALNMFSRISTFFAFALLAAATNPPVTTTVTVTAPGHTSTPIPASQCNTGGLQCCNNVQSANSAAASGLLALLGVVVQDLTIPIGLTCSPINVLGIGAGGACTAQPVCCSNNEFHGVVAIGCTPINIGL